MVGRMDGKVALVSGAARGMGAAEARCFAAEGARVVLGDVLDEEGAKVASEIGENASYVHLDVTNEESWIAAVAHAQQRFGKLDALVNNAGILRFNAIETTSLEEYETVIRVNQVGCFLGMKSAIPALRAAGGGSIVNISSAAGLEAMPGIVSYCSSKFAIRGMTKVAALEFGAANVRVNSVHPGGTNTAMLAFEGHSNADREEHQPPQPIKRMAEPEEIAELVLWLASDASRYCTGAEFVIDGGLTAGSPFTPIEG